jgi:two-component system response regulator MtrA
MTRHILVVEDDRSLSETVGLLLTSAGYRVTACYNGLSAIEAFKKLNPDLILLDIQIPEPNGIEVCREIRRTSGVPIVMVTAKSESDDIVEGLNAGADDYIPKPFNHSELLARVSARLRGKPEGTPSSGVLTIGPLTLDIEGHEVKRGNERLSLTPLEFNLLLTLASQPSKVFSREDLLEKVWGYHYKADTRLVNVHVQRLRSKIEDDPEDPQIVTTIRGIGYRAGSPVADSAE